MNRSRLTILRDHLASLPDERVNMLEPYGGAEAPCCVGGWTRRLFGPDAPREPCLAEAGQMLGLNGAQGMELFFPRHLSRYTRTDAISAIQSMLDSPDDDALPVWPERESS